MNNTVVTDPLKGCRLNKLEPVYRQYGIPQKYNFLLEEIVLRDVYLNIIVLIDPRLEDEGW